MNDVTIARWFDCSQNEDRSLLRATIRVCGAPVLIEAHEVKTEETPDGPLQVSVGSSDYHGRALGFELDSAVQVATIEGRTYALFARSQDLL